MPKSSDSLTATNLKDHLWHTLQAVKDGTMAPGAGDVVASQAREILRTVRTQLAIFAQSNTEVSEELKDFANPLRTPKG